MSDQARDLALTGRCVRLEESCSGLLLCILEHVHAHLRPHTARCLSRDGEGIVSDPALKDSLLDECRRATSLLDAIKEFDRLGLDRIGQALDEVGAGEGIDRSRDA